ncbi:MAG: PDZ domain-containing protein [Bacteroidota bacterium]
MNEKQFEGNFLLDTGSQMPAIFNSPMARKNKIASQIEKSIAIERKAGVSEVSSKFVLFRGQQLEIFGKSFDEIPSAYSTASSGALASTGFQGIIGNPVLKRFNIILDYSKEKMYVNPNRLYDVPFLADCSGIAFDVKRDDKKLIAEFIVEHSPADKAGINLGDELLTINGKSSGSYTSDELDNLLRKPGNQLKIQYKRGNELLEASLITKDLL